MDWLWEFIARLLGWTGRSIGSSIFNGDGVCSAGEEATANPALDCGD